MKTTELVFARPADCEARAPPEARGLARDEVRLLVSTPASTEHGQFRDLPRLLSAGDILVVNESLTLAASLPATGRRGAFRLNLSTDFGRGIYVAEPRPAVDQPGPMPFDEGERVHVAGIPTRFIARYPGLPRLWFVRADRDLGPAMAQQGRPIRYGYLDHEFPLDQYQTVFGRVAGSAEMPSAGRPFSSRLLVELARAGIGWVPIVLHAGVSSQEIEAAEVEWQPMYPEPFEVSPQTATAIAEARRRRNRVIAVGTTVVRALESAWDGRSVQAMRGFTRRYVTPDQPVGSVDGMLTGFHDARTSHLAMLYAVSGVDRIRRAYAEAAAARYLWHEFGDSHLLLNR
ncbi:MAG: S-adenosylmethionine:tRNA ribosyltransferase-isomerase [Thermoplasmata archaeon]|nr:S-adenosylmethionine:tRNA ribosyltransferase-isomerase [Thermoplasmata archaeon]